MKAITVRQPWAWAIIHGGKDVENRTRNIAGSYRGPLAIHAGLTVDRDAIASPLVDNAWRDRYGWGPAASGLFEVGIFVGVVDLVGVHDERLGCCGPWGERSHDGSRRVHLELAHPRSLGYLPEPLRCRGQLGLWTPPAHILDTLETR